MSCGNASSGRALRVAVLAPISWRVPPVHYGPWEQFASLLSEGLVARGMDVTLFATKSSITRARLIGSAPRGYSEDEALDAKAWECLQISSVFERAREFDIIHNGFDFLPLSYSSLVSTPVVTTIHGFSSERILPVYQKYDRSTHYVAISDADRHSALQYAATIHHGIDMASFRLGRGPRKYLLFFGRIHPHKGTREAIEIAKMAGLPLVIAGIVQDGDYFRREVEPHIDGWQVRFIGAVAARKKSALLGGARALLHYVSFDEPFGFSVVEAMACGTPVVATPRGAMPELIRDARVHTPADARANGWLVRSLAEAADAAGDVGKLNPAEVRESVERRFDAMRMVDDYIALYRQILASKDGADVNVARSI